MIVLLILSIIQGLTEFLPISSSGHLVLAKEWLGFAEQGLEMELWLHIGTLFALIAYFWKDLLKLAVGILRPEEAESNEKNWPILIIIATVITGVFGIVGRKFFLKTFDDLTLTYWGFIVTAVILFVTRWAPEKRSHLDWKDAALFGLAQAFAIFPSISRSGATIACLLLLGVDSKTAFRFSFIASIPAILGAFVLEMGVGSFAIFNLKALTLSFIVTFASGLFALAVLRRLVTKHCFYIFGFYCLLLGAAGLLFWR